MQKQPFTNMTITALKPRPNKYELFDNRVGGLSVQVYPSGKKSFCLNYRVGESPKRKRMRFVDPKVVTINEARAMATQLKEKARSGIDPNEERKQAVNTLEQESENTIAKLADEFVERYCVGAGTEPNLKSWKEYMY